MQNRRLRRNQRLVFGLLAATAGAFSALSGANERDGVAKPSAEMQQVLTQLQSMGGKPIEELSAPMARKQPAPSQAVQMLLKSEGKSIAPETVAKVEDRSIPGQGGPIPIKIYWPEGQGPFPVTVYYHGGGWVIATPETYDSSPRALVNGARTIVVSVDYRQAPEHKFPAAHEDAFTAYQWALKNAASIRGRPDRVAVAGESAGGNLAVAVSMMARDRNEKLPVYELVIYPIASPKMDTASYRENANAKPLNKAMMAWFFDKYLRTSADAKDPRIDLVNADLKGLPATTLITAEIDPLRSEGQELAKRLKDAGVPVTYKNFEGVTHEFFGMGAAVTQAKDAEKLASDDLKKGFSG